MRMYNAELKGRFLNEMTASEDSRKSAELMFDSFGRVESRYNLDLYEMDQNQLEEALNETNAVRQASAVNRKEMMKKYLAWCAAQGICGENKYIDNIEADLSGNIRRYLVANPAHMQMILNQSFYPEDDDTIENTYRVYLWMAYSGMADADIFKLTADNINLSEMTVYLRNREYPIYRESIKAVKKCITLTAFERKNLNYKKKCLQPRAGGKTLLRGVLNKELNEEFFKQRINRRIRMSAEQHQVDIKLSYSRAWKSGIFYRMYEMETAGARVDFGPAADAFMVQQEYKSKRIDAVRRNYVRLYEQDYNAWKKVYHG